MADTSGPESCSTPPNANFKGGFKLPAPGAVASEVQEEFPRTRSEGSHDSPQTRPPRQLGATDRVHLTGVPLQSPESPGRRPRARRPSPARYLAAGARPRGDRGALSCHRARTHRRHLRAPRPPLPVRRGGSVRPGEPRISAARTPVTCPQTITNSPARSRPVPGAARLSGLGGAGPPRVEPRKPCSVLASFIARPPDPARPAAHPEGAAAAGGSVPAGLRAPLSRAAASSAGWAPPQRLAAPGGGGSAAGWKALAPAAATAAASAGSGDGEVDGQGGEAVRKSGGSGSWSSSTLRTLRSCRRRQSARSRPTLPVSRSSPAPAVDAPLPWRAPPPPPASGLAAAAPGNPDDEARSPAAAAIFSRGLHSLVPAGEGGGGESAGGGRSGRRAGGRARAGAERAGASEAAPPGPGARSRRVRDAGGRAEGLHGGRAGRCVPRARGGQVVRGGVAARRELAHPCAGSPWGLSRWRWQGTRAGGLTVGHCTRFVASGWSRPLAPVRPAPDAQVAPGTVAGRRR